VLTADHAARIRPQPKGSVEILVATATFHHNEWTVTATGMPRRLATRTT